MGDSRRLSRRSFLKFVAANLAAASLRIPGDDEFWHPEIWPVMEFDDLPPAAKRILEIVPQTHINQEGYLILSEKGGQPLGQVPLARTRWNLERTQPVDRLHGNVPWGIVLHWYGDKENFTPTVAGYLRGFDSLRWVTNYLTRTSAHFLVGANAPSDKPARPQDPIAILQTQAPDADGWPFLASHLQPLDHQAHRERRQYFVRALYQLGYREPRLHSILQDYFDGPRVDPNLNTIAIEICGYDFEHPEHAPSDEQIANVISVIWSTMKRYRIQAVNILGHHEIQLGKADPGKKFLALIRYLIGLKALVENDMTMKRLVFGRFLDQDGEPEQAVRRYFSFVRDYLVLVATQKEVYEWEKASNYWIAFDRFAEGKIRIARTFRRPLDELQLSQALNFLKPENHEGIDLLIRGADNRYNKTVTSDAYLVADGICLFIGENDRCSPGQSAIFSHIQPDGAQILSVYGNLNELTSLRAGESYPLGYRVGTIQSSRFRWNPSLHFAVAFGATWDTDLKIQASIPINAGTSWIQARYLNPLEYL